jgi:hypothetical protein
VNLFDFACADTDKKLIFTYPDQHLGQGGHRKDVQGRELTIICKKLDNFMDKDFTANLVKIDVEGMEYEVILGMSEIINRSNDIILTVEKNFIESGEILIEYWNLLRKLNLFPVALPAFGEKFYPLNDKQFVEFIGTYIASKNPLNFVDCLL